MTARYPADLSTVSSVKPIPPPAVFGPPRSHHPEPAKRPRVRPLPEAKAIESGANFISEFFLFAVAGSLILAEQIRARRKEASRRDLVLERLELLEDRTRQDEERLVELEERSRHDEEQILMLEEENWRQKGGRGVFPGREHAEKKERKIFEPTPLWEEVSQKSSSLWTSIWGFGNRNEDDVGDKTKMAFAVVNGTQQANGEESPTDYRNTAASSRLPAILKRIRPTSSPELPTSDETAVKTPTPSPSHLSK